MRQSQTQTQNNPHNQAEHEAKIKRLKQEEADMNEHNKKEREARILRESKK